jgi:serine phosphatase RsbU (regulator of sigma subunit)
MGYIAVRRFFSTEKKLLALEQELSIARRIQRSNLPDHLPSTENVGIAARYIPMSAVAGDFYDIHVDDKGGIGILIADVSGHGVGAALIGSMLKIAFASQREHLADPARVLGEINRILRGKIEESFVTACAVFIDKGKALLRYSNAGHPPPLVWTKSNGALSRLSDAGTMLGPFPNARYENTDLKFSDGDRLLLYTDGVCETRNKQGEFFGEDRIESFLKEHWSLSADVSVDRIIEQVFAWSGRSEGASLDDDLTLMIVDLLGGDAR